MKQRKETQTQRKKELYKEFVYNFKMKPEMKFEKKKK